MLVITRTQRRTPWLWLRRHARIALLRWLIRADENYLRACAVDDLLTAATRHELRRNLQALRVRLALEVAS